MKIWLLAFVMGASLATSAARAFSPYEAYLMSGRDTHVGLISVVQPEKESLFREAVAKCHGSAVRGQLQESGITRLGFFTRTIQGKQYAVAYFTYAGGNDYLGAAKAFEAATHSMEWAAFTQAHPRAAAYDCHWLQMEWVNFVGGLDVDREPTSLTMIGTRIRPEKEGEYRTLHQTVWPGVVDQIKRGSIRNLNVFLVELDGDLVEFLYLEYMGNDSESDDLANQQDPINQRWWKLTDACQQPFEGVTEGNWAALEQVK